MDTDHRMKIGGSVPRYCAVRGACTPEPRRDIAQPTLTPTGKPSPAPDADALRSTDMVAERMMRRVRASYRHL